VLTCVCVCVCACVRACVCVCERNWETAPQWLTNDVRWNRQIKSLEVELKKQFAQDKVLKNGEESKESEPYYQPVSIRSAGATHSSIHLLSTCIKTRQYERHYPLPAPTMK